MNITKCINSGTVTGRYSTGGFFGFFYGNHNVSTVNIPLSDNGFWILLQFAVRGGGMIHIGISEKTDVNK